MPLHKDDPKSVGGYKLVDRLGSGGMGVVYWGRSRSGRDVAVKVVHAQYAEDKVFRARFRHEIESVRKVSGAFTAPVVDADPEAIRPWMATQYVPGSSLAERIRDHGALKGAELRRLALGLVEALEDIHRAGVVHRDLKPANVLMAEDGPRVIDFGISRAAENHQTLTETGQMIGTPPFMSPEQFTDARTVGPASDVFSLAALLVFSATGRGPFDADSPYLTAFRVVHEAPGLDGVPQPLRTVLERCLVKEAADRPRLDVLAKEFAEALPEPDPMDPDTTTLRLADLRSVEETYGDADPAMVTGLPKPRSRTRRGRRPLLVTVGTLGVVSLSLLGYIRFGPGFSDTPQETSSVATSGATRWSAVPKGWQAWQTTMFETARSGEVNPLAKAGEDTSDATCQPYENAVYCAGNTVLPVRLDSRTGATVWRSALATSAEGTDSSGNNFALLGVRDDAMILQHDVFAADGSTRSSIVALDTETGDQLWARDRGGPSADQLMAGDLIMTPDAGGRLVTARSPRTGTDRWTTQLPAGDYCSFGTADSRLYAHCFPDDESKEAVLLELDKTDGTVRRRLSTPNGSGLLGTVDGRLAVGVAVNGGSGPARLEENTFGEIRLIDPDTGATTTTELKQTYKSSIRLAAGTVWITGANGQVTAVSPLTGKQLWQTRTSVEDSGRPTYDPTTHTLYLASISGRVAALDSRKGTLLWETGARADQLASGETTKSKVSLDGGAVVVNTPNGTVFSLDPAHPEG
ncbi:MULTISPECIES: serine/threonine-protein kinase [unclassified Streptomyces]|uniref:serine/threonine-protein kinase n=1 Tax=unclassified Streptomyces TaxID=2593676 RepID=UPI00224E88EC|nr:MULTISPECIES: serine/threonine-protein kinase [unclassified Streptomyces]MCX5334714.1 serine/threonine-protein kinase [Streptomyces sp. NBC_00140]MCX5364208.1 serine/threonine-protein kinase [Streptomyces sp. NBC_00124]